jgi:hypothetical protein
MSRLNTTCLVLLLLCAALLVYACRKGGMSSLRPSNRLVVDEPNLEKRVPLYRDECIEVCLGIGSVRDDLEVDGILRDQGDLIPFIIQRLDQDMRLKAIVFSVGISNNNHDQVESLLRNLSKDRSIEFYLFFENSKYSLGYKQ